MYLQNKVRIKYAERMDAYLRNHVPEDLVEGIWCMRGVPDGASQEDYNAVKDDDAYWSDCLEAFMACVILAAMDDGEDLSMRRRNEANEKRCG